MSECVTAVGCSVGKTGRDSSRPSYSVTFALTYCNSDPSANAFCQAIAQGCWCVRAVSYAGLRNGEGGESLYDLLRENCHEPHQLKCHERGERSPDFCTESYKGLDSRDTVREQ